MTFSRCRRVRRLESCSWVSFLTWWVALRASVALPSVQPLIVCARMTVGLPVWVVAALYAAYIFWLS